MLPGDVCCSPYNQQSHQNSPRRPRRRRRRRRNRNRLPKLTDAQAAATRVIIPSDRSGVQASIRRYTLRTPRIIVFDTTTIFCDCGYRIIFSLIDHHLFHWARGDARSGKEPPLYDKSRLEVPRTSVVRQIPLYEKSLRCTTNPTTCPRWRTPSAPNTRPPIARNSPSATERSCRPLSRRPSTKRPSAARAHRPFSRARGDRARR